MTLFRGRFDAKRILLAAVGGFALTAGSAQAVPPQPTHYTVTPETVDGTLRDLAVEVKLQGDADGETKIAMPNEWSGAHELYKAVHDLRAEGATLSMNGPAEVVLRHAPNAPVTLRYRVVQDFAGDPAVSAGGPPFRAVTRPKWFSSVGWTLFGEVKGRVNDPVSFSWGAAPAGWAQASDLDHAAPNGRRMIDLLDSVLVGGEGLQVTERQVAGGRLRVVVPSGQWRFTEASMADLAGKIAEASSQFWGDKGEDFFVALTPLNAPGGSTVQYGLGLGDSFALWATPNVELTTLKHILAHEHQHTWFPGRFGGVRGGAEEPLDYWFSEGFTDFYTLRLLLRAGVYSPEEFVTDFNRILRNYSASPALGATNAQIAKAYWTDRAMADQPYQRGLLLAATWDHRLRQATGGQKGLDDVVRAMRGREGGAIARLEAAYPALGGGSLMKDVANYVDAGGRVLLPADLFGDCAEVRTIQSPVFDRGFDTAKTSARFGVVDGVDPAGPAYAAGLRNGMRILKREGGQNGDSRVDLIYRVSDAQGERVIRYKPEGRQTMTLQEIVLAPNMTPEKRAACAASMAGYVGPALQGATRTTHAGA
ncbi:hypothetical protein [Caulobacter sp. 17J80-11]|uniref:M61 family metallopeptidase n=1 Tax=Caulobacter sp. 17J80-11 TaxID=2763502 RepID=UPI001653C0A2|nr:hypothetical protein [Caulobacter sp. 17J80-11]MBC6981590.1 hypothetical protein [Caulobacter sp. 17J80-11]